jgi:hypothetical protein
MSWHNNSFNFWKSDQIMRNNLRFQVSVALLLFIIMIIVVGCADGGAALDGLKDDPDLIDLGEDNVMNNESAEQKDAMPVIDQNIPEDWKLPPWLWGDFGVLMPGSGKLKEFTVPGSVMPGAVLRTRPTIT